MLPRPLAAPAWVRRHRDLAPSFLAEFAVGSGTAQLGVLLVGIVGGLSVVGSLRAATLVLGPALLALSAAPGVAIPELVPLVSRSRSHFSQTLTAISAGLAALVVAWGLFAYWLPERVGETILGPNWAAARHVLLPVTATWAALGVLTGAQLGLRALAAARRSLTSRLLMAPLTIVGMVFGVSVAGARGAAVGQALAACAGAGVWWRQCVSAMRRHTTWNRS